MYESTPETPTETAIATVLDALPSSGHWVGLAAAALCTATFHALGAEAAPSIVALALLGTLAVYAVDRLRDLDRDGLTVPARSAFVARHSRLLQAISIASAAAAALCAFHVGPHAVAIAASVLVVGLLHRRLKRWSPLQPIYVVCAWLAVAVGLPVVATPDAANAAWITGVLAAALFANVSAPHALGVARAFAASGVVLAALAPLSVRPLGAVAVATGFALLQFRATERYCLGVLDGALVAG